MGQIKLVASDVDGTLLQEGTPFLNPEYYDVIRQLKKQGIPFVVATGRQFVSVRTVFAPVEEEVYFISDNGAHILKGKETIFCETIPPEVVEEIVAYVRTIPDAFMLFSTAEGAFTDSTNEKYISKNEKGYKVNMGRVDDILSVKDRVMKIAVCCEDRDATTVAEPAIERFGAVASVTASGAHWVDFMALGMNKGDALKKIQAMLQISKEETMAFGDNHNDISMLKAAQESYAVAGAREETKNAVKYVLPGEKADEVLDVLKSLCR